MQGKKVFGRLLTMHEHCASLYGRIMQTNAEISEMEQELQYRVDHKEHLSDHRITAAIELSLEQRRNELQRLAQQAIEQERTLHLYHQELAIPFVQPDELAA